jgi:hypothetical protein
LHAAADWPVFFSNGPELVAILIAAAADPNVAPRSTCRPDGRWNVARLLVERGARVDRHWHAAALGMTRAQCRARRHAVVGWRRAARGHRSVSTGRWR